VGEDQVERVGIRADERFDQRAALGRPARRADVEAEQAQPSSAAELDLVRLVHQRAERLIVPAQEISDRPVGVARDVESPQRCGHCFEQRRELSVLDRILFLFERLNQIAGVDDEVRMQLRDGAQRLFLPLGDVRRLDVAQMQDPDRPIDRFRFDPHVPDLELPRLDVRRVSAHPEQKESLQREHDRKDRRPPPIPRGHRHRDQRERRRERQRIIENAEGPKVKEGRARRAVEVSRRNDGRHDEGTAARGGGDAGSKFHRDQRAEPLREMG
jgi:hypothetical protein